MNPAWATLKFVRSVAGAGVGVALACQSASPPGTNGVGAEPSAFIFHRRAPQQYRPLVPSSTRSELKRSLRPSGENLGLKSSIPTKNGEPSNGRLNVSRVIAVPSAFIV